MRRDCLHFQYCNLNFGDLRKKDCELYSEGSLDTRTSVLFGYRMTRKYRIMNSRPIFFVIIVIATNLCVGEVKGGAAPSVGLRDPVMMRQTPVSRDQPASTEDETTEDKSGVDYQSVKTLENEHEASTAAGKCLKWIQ